MPSAGNRQVIPYVMGCAVLLQTMDATAIATALPSFARTFGVDPVTASQAITSYLVGMALTVPAGGWLADRFGSRTMFCILTAVMTLSAIACALASSLTMLVAARFVGGAAASMIVPIGRLMVVRSVPRDKLVEAVTTFATVGQIGLIVGPVIAGMIIQFLSWRALFLAVALMGLLAIVTVWVLTQEDRQEQPGTFDLVGFGFSAAGLGSIVVGMEMLGHGSMTPMTMLLMVIGCALLAVLYFHAQRRAEPLVRVDLLRRPILRASVLADFPVRMVLAATPMLISLYLQVGLGQSALLTGVILFAPAIGSLLLIKPALDRGGRRFGIPRVMAACGVGAALSFASTAAIRDHAWAWLILVPLFIHGVTRNVITNGSTVLNFMELDSEELGAATGLTAMIQQVAMVLGVGLATLLLRAAGKPLTLGALSMVILIMSGVVLLSASILFAVPRSAIRTGQLLRSR